MAGRFTRQVRSGAKRHPDWSDNVPLTSFTGIAASSAVLLTVFTPTGGGETVIRTRGLFGWKSDQNAAAEDQLGAVGICKVSAQAVSVGITAIPHPDTDAGFPWLWHSFFASSFVFGTNVGLVPDMFHRIVIDSKAMRKVTDDERIVVVIENSAPFGLLVYDSVRIMTKLF